MLGIKQKLDTTRAIEHKVLNLNSLTLSHTASMSSFGNLFPWEITLNTFGDIIVL